MDSFLKSTSYFDYDHPVFAPFLNELANYSDNEIVSKAIYIHDYVRDGWNYNPYKMHFSPASCQASTIFERNEGHCLDKATLLITLLRGANIPARLHLAKVKNHIAVEHLIKVFGTDELTPHGYVEIYINEKWLGATPAFNKLLCDKLNVQVLEFNGKEDSIFQQYDKVGNRFMEYLDDYGTFDDFPLDFVKNNIVQNYPKIKPIVESE